MHKREVNAVRVIEGVYGALWGQGLGSGARST